MPQISKASQVASLANDIVSVKDFGAVGDGVADDTAAIVNALAGGGTITADGVYALSGATLLSLTGLNYFNIISGTRLVSTPNTEFRILSNQLADGTRFEVTGDNVIIDGGVFKEVNAVLGRHNFYGTIAGSGANYVDILNVTTNGSNGAGMHFRQGCSNFNITNARILNGKSDGLHIQRGCHSFSIVAPHIEGVEDDCIGIVGHGRNEGWAAPTNVEILGGYLGAQANGAVGSGLAVIGANNVRAVGIHCQDNGLSSIRITDFTDAGEGNYGTSNVTIESPVCINGGVTTNPSGGLVKDGVSIANVRNVKITNPYIENPVNSGITISNASIDVQIIDPVIRGADDRGIWIAAATRSDAHILEMANNYNDTRYAGAATSLKCEYLVISNADVQTSGTDGFYVDGALVGDVVNPTFRNIRVDTSNVGNTAGKYGVFMSDTVGLKLDGVAGGVSFSGTAITPLVFVNADYERITNVSEEYVSTTYPTHMRGLIREFWSNAAPVTAPAVGSDYRLGDLVYNYNPASGTTYWICTVVNPGASGTWVAK